MTDFFDLISNLSPKRLVLLALEQHEQIEATNRRARAPIAIVGMACRFPGGATDPAAFWELLRAGRDAIGEVPRDRWDIDALFDPDPDAPARMSVRNGGFLSDIGEFDPAFFGIAPREALTMDPQQRLLLETAWEALEHAGIAAERLVGSATGVFVGICNSDHFNRLVNRGHDAIDAYLASGNAHSVAAGRVAYFLGLQGPALSIDTACSSSLVALHVACRSLRGGESRVALAAGVNVMCSPETTIALSKAHMLAPDGRCKTFDASADGFSRGEGCGVLVLKRLEDAQADSDRVLAVIRGTAVNQDGHSGGLTVPNGPAQEAVIRLALADAGAEASEIAYVEAHGTGTSLGDPIEVRALAGALAAGRTQADPLLIGSVKTNFGHLESAAGIAGVMKVVLALQNERIPQHLHFRTPSPHIAWNDYPVKVTSQAVPWPRGARRRLAGVSSFGFSGTNAHVVLEEAPLAARSAGQVSRSLHCLPLSARSSEGLSSLAGSYASVLAATSDDAFVDVIRTAGAGRSHFSERAAIVAASAAEAQTALRALRLGKPHAALHRGTALPGQSPEVVFLFTGQGSQYPGMSQALYAGSAVFRDVIDRCDTLLGADRQGRTLKTVLWTQGGDHAPIHETAWTQPALFAVEYGLTEVWRSWGIEPAAVIGHSVGEYVAACVAGVFTLEDGLRLIAERGRLMQALPAGGTMAALFAPVDEVAAIVAPFADRVAIAAINAADSVVISGEANAIDRVLEVFAKRDVRGHRLFISLAAHSPLVQPALEAMQACAAGVTMRAPRVPVAWNLTGGKPLPSGAAPDAAYWRRHLREPVQFAAGISKLLADGFRTFLEVGPHPTLMALAQRSLPEGGVAFANSLRRGKEDWSEMLTGLAGLYARGANVDWAGVNDPFGGQRCTLPTYPFERRKYWLPLAAPASAQVARRPTGLPHKSSLRAERLPTAAPIFQTTLTPTAPAYLAQHVVHGAVLVAGPVFLELAQACANEALGASSRAVEAFVVREPLVLPHEGRTIEIHLTPTEDATGFSIHSRDLDAKGPWTLHATGRLMSRSDSSAAASSGTAVLAALQGTLGPPADSADYYEKLKGLGIELGAAFRTLREAHRRDGEALARIELPKELQTDNVAWAHPALLDGALQSVGLAVPSAADRSEVYLLTGVEHVSLHGALPRNCWSHARIRAAAGSRPAEWIADVTLLAANGVQFGTLRGVCLRRAPREALQQAVQAATAAAVVGASSPDGLFYRLVWEDAPAAPIAAPFLAAPRSFEGAVRDSFAHLAAEHGMGIYEELLPELDRLSASHVVTALQRLGFDDRIGRVFDVASEATRLGVLPRHARLFARMLTMLVEDGSLRRCPNGSCETLEVTGALTSIESAQHYDALLNRFGAVNGELLTLRRCAFELAGVLNGTQDPLQLLFPGGSLTQARQLYVESPYARTYNTALAWALRSAIAALPADARLRVLEIGAGTGGTTTYVLPLLPTDRVEYTFTDLSPLFLERAAEQFAAYPFIKYALLDIERDPAAQGFELGQYDVVIAANVLHATADLTTAVRHARGLLASGGLLLLLEGVAPERWVDLTFGLTEGWWRFTDTGLRAGYPLIGRDAWRELLTGLDFDSIAAIPSGVPPSRGASQQALIMARAPVRRRSWTLVGDMEGLGAVLAGKLRERGETIAQYPADAAESALPPDGELVYLGALELAARDCNDSNAVEACARLACELPLRWLGWAAKQSTSPRVWLVTRGAQPATAQMAPGARWQAPLWGVGRVFALEHPAKWGGLLDLPPQCGHEDFAQFLLTAADSGDAEDQVAWRDGKRFVARLLPAQPPAESAMRFRSDATYLITGGFGGLGLLVARWMADNGARHLALLGRTPDIGSDAVRAIEARGARVIALTGDVADEATMTANLARLAADGPPLRGIVHAAAALSAAPVGALSAEQVRAMLRPKVEGTVLLERLTRALELDFVVFFSSTTALLGASGMAHYAAANAFLDATALALDGATTGAGVGAVSGSNAASNESSVGSGAVVNGHVRRVLSVNWGTWEAMRLASVESQRSYRESGLEPMPAAAALAALGQLLPGREAQVTVAQVDWSVLKPLHETRRVRPFLTHLGHGPIADAAAGPGATVTAAGAAAAAPVLLERLAQAPATMRHELLIDFVRGEAAAVLGVEGGEDVALDVGLFEMGMDSLMSVELRRRLERGAARKLPSTLTFNYPNVGALAGFLERELVVAELAGEPERARQAGQSSGRAEQDAEQAGRGARQTGRNAGHTEQSSPACQPASPGAADGNLDELSDEELEARLLARLSGIR